MSLNESIVEDVGLGRFKDLGYALGQPIFTTEIITR